jgi:hypothetical protein
MISKMTETLSAAQASQLRTVRNSSRGPQDIGYSEAMTFASNTAPMEEPAPLQLPNPLAAWLAAMMWLQQLQTRPA